MFSIIIVNYNGFAYTKACIYSILNNNYNNYEIIIVDNGSEDNSPISLKNEFQDKISLVLLEKNFGPSHARNEGVNISKGRIICFLDNDTEVHPDWIVEAKKIFDQEKNIGILQCKLLLYHDKTSIDYAGEFIGPNGFIVHNAETGVRDEGQYDNTGDILAAKSAGMFIHREAFEKAGGFDPDYFIYVEETDLGWRTRLVGHRVVFAPKSIVYHHFSTSRTILGISKNQFNTRFHGSKNYICTLLKNLEYKNIIFIFSRHLLIWIGFAIFRLLCGNLNEFNHIMRGIWWNIKNLNKTLKKRQKIQDVRTVTDKELFAISLKKEGILRKAYIFFKATIFIKRMDNLIKKKG